MDVWGSTSHFCPKVNIFADSFRPVLGNFVRVTSRIAMCELLKQDIDTGYFRCWQGWVLELVSAADSVVWGLSMAMLMPLPTHHQGWLDACACEFLYSTFLCFVVAGSTIAA